MLFETMNIEKVWMRVAALLISLKVVCAKTVPKQIIQTSKSKELAFGWEEYRNSLRLVNPDFTFRHFDDAEAFAFIEDHYANTTLETAYDIATPILKADLFRLAAIYKLGGFYMDMDLLGKTSLDPLVEQINRGSVQAVFPKEWWMSDDAYRGIFPGLNGPSDPEDHWQVGQYAFAAVPGHPFVRDVLKEAIKRTIHLISTKRKEDIQDGDILATTGPHL